ncbi:MAG: hypothetical protein V4674_02390 [Patescibacteria group bacterium]
MTNYKRGSTAAVLVSAVVGLLVGYGIARGTNGSAVPAGDMAPTSVSKAADLRVVLNAIERQHVDLASTAVRNAFDGSADTNASVDALSANTKRLSDAVASVYGAEAGKKFSDIWSSHIGFFVDYTLAAKAGDKAKMDKAVQNLGGYADAVSDFLSQANPNLPREAVHGLVMQHIGHLKGAVDAYGRKDYAGSYTAQSEAYEQIGKIADAIAEAIVKQKPEAFN